MPDSNPAPESGLSLPPSFEQFPALGNGGAQTGAAVEEKPHPWREVPWRTIVAAVGVVLATYVVMEMLVAALRIIAWVLIAGFFAVVLAPAVRRVESRVGGRRSLATGVVVFATLLVIAGLVALFVIPVRRQLGQIVTDLPGTVEEAADGRGPIGGLVRKLGLVDYVRDHEEELTNAAERLEESAFDILGQVLEGVIAFITITLLTFFFLSQAHNLGNGLSNMVPMRRRESVKRVSRDAAHAISGYMIGNLLISLYAGVTAFLCLWILGVPAPIVLALWVAFADLIPLVGATLGAAVAVLAAYLHSPTAGIIALIFFVVYQQIENGVIYPVVMSRKVRVNPLLVLVSVLLGVELFGFVGAVFAVPVSGAVQVIVRSIRIERQRERLHIPEPAPS